MNCKLNISEIIVNELYSDKILVKLYGSGDQPYSPLYSNHLIQRMVKDLEKINIHVHSIVVVTHTSTECNFTLPTSSWVSCDFKTIYDNHCKEILNTVNNDNYRYVIPLDINSIADGSYEIEGNTIQLNTFSILSEWYFKIRPDTLVHLTELDNISRKTLYDHLSISYQTLITDSSYMNVDRLDISSDDKVILIPSIFNVIKNRPLRNIYSQEERFRQTLKQVKSIYKQYSNMKSIILELNFMSLRQIHKLSRYCSGIIFFNKDSKAVEYSVHGNKNIAEVYLLRFMYKALTNINYSHISKFGGRYHLTDNFNKNIFFRDKPVFRYIESAYDGKHIYESIFYSIPRKFHTKFEEVLKIMEETLSYSTTDVEHLLYSIFGAMDIEKYHIDKIGIKGYFAGSGIYNSS